MRKLTRLFFYVLYYGFARRLPVSYMPGGKLARKIRGAACRHLFAGAGKNINVERNADFRSGRKVFLGDNSDLGENSRIMGSVRIGNNVMMGPDVLIISMNHKFLRTDIPMNTQGFHDDRPVVIGDDVWIGARAVILSGVRIGSGVIIGAGAVVAKDIPDWAVAVGNPARILKFRNEIKQEAEPQHA